MTGPSDGSAWVMGASSGIGRAAALELARQGWKVFASARRADELHDLERQAAALAGSVVARPCDVLDRDAVAAAAAEIARDHGPLGLVLVSAGTSRLQHPLEIDAERIRQLFDLNVMGTVHCLEAILPIFDRQGHGHVGLVASVAGYRGLPTSMAYSGTKAALIAMAEGLKFDMDDKGLKLTLINPGFVNTPLTEKNRFPMPFIISAEEAAKRMVAALRADRFEVSFPRRLAWPMKLFACLPYRLYFPVVKWITKR